MLSTSKTNGAGVLAIAAVDAAAAAFPAWSALGPNDRRQRLSRAADLLASRADDFVAAMSEEIGATRAWAGFNVHLATGMLREAAAMTTQIGGEVIPSDRPDRLAMAMRQPAGVCLGIAPWNAPLILGVRALAMPLACGNTVVLKASELCPKTHSLIGQVMQEALGKDVVTVVTNTPEEAPEIVRRLIEHPSIRRINFTGSTRIGRIIAETAGRVLKPVLLELGGKAPLIVLDDADIGEAVNAAAFGAFMNQGQICMSTERLVVEQSVADTFVERLVAKAKSLSVGDSRKGDVAIGCLIAREPVERIGRLIKDAINKGAKVLCGGTAEGVIMQPTVIDNVTSDMEIYHEETFGPVVCVVRVPDVDAAIQVANDTEYGLAAAVFTKDIAKALTLVPKIASGSFHINGPTVQDEAQMPFGGMKASGYGRFGGKAAIAEFTDIRWVTIETKPMHYPF